MSELHQTEIDGVQCFWVPSGRPTLAATLAFRAGMSDETFVTRGWLHLLEHLALHGRGGGALHVNGSVSALTTTFDVHGPVEDVAGHLNAVTAWLAAPDLRDLDHELRVLRAESLTRNPGPIGQALVWRYGMQGSGLMGANESGLTVAVPEKLTRLAGDTFTASNAVLVLDGPPPASLRLGLPQGDGRQPIKPVRSLETDFPAMYTSPALIASGTVERSEVGPLVPVLLQNAVRARLRHGDGTSYAPWSHYEHIDSDTALVLVGADISPDGVPTSAELLAGTIEHLAQTVPADDLHDVVAAAVQAMRDPYAIAGFGWRSAIRWLQGHEPEPFEDVVRGVETVTSDELAAGVASVHASLLLGVLDGARKPKGFRSIDRPKPRGGTGTTFKAANWPGDPSRLTIAQNEVRVTGTMSAWGVGLDDLAGLIKHPAGVRTLVALDGWNLTVDPVVWKGGDRATTLIDQRVPDDLHVEPLSTEIGEPPRRWSWWKRWGKGFRRGLRTPTALWIYIALAIVLGIAGLAAKLYLAPLAAAIMIRSAARELKVRRYEQAKVRAG